MDQPVGQEATEKLNGHTSHHAVPARFGGFARPNANFLFTPNQYLDLCVPHCSRGCVRLVGYMLRHLLGWRDAKGNALYEKVEVTQRELERQARVGKSSINAALDEAERLGFIENVRRGRPNRRGKAAVQNAWALRWDDSGEYAETIETFAGFYRGQGRRTTIPNQFFDDVLPHEKLAVVKVVGAVLRHTVGYHNRLTGTALTEAPLSFSKLCDYTGMVRSTLAEAVRQAVASRYIEIVEKGRFSPQGADQVASVYTVCWADPDDESGNAPKIEPGPKGPVELVVGTGRPENRTSQAPRKSNQERPENRTEQRPENRTTRKTETHPQRQQQAAAGLERRNSHAGDPASNPPTTDPVALLRVEGVDAKVARQLADRHGLDEIRKQIAWLPYRKVTSNRVGLLRRAIEEAYEEPPEVIADRERRAAEAQRRAAAEAEELERRREQHARAAENAYFAYLLAQEQKLKRDQPERFEAMLVKHAQERVAIAQGNWPPRLKEKMLAVHDREDAYLTALLRTFRDELPDFWTWDAEHHDRPFKP